MTRFAPWLLAAGVLLASPAAAPAQGPQPPGQPLTGNGFEVFRALLDLAKITPVSARELQSNRFDDLIVVIIGNPQQNFGGFFTPLTVAERTLQQGGTVLIAHDSLLDIPINRGTQTRINGQRVAVTDPALGYQGRLLDPLLVPVEGDDPVFGLFDGLTRVATEHPSFIEMSRGGFDNRRVLARFPNGGSVFQNTQIEFDTTRFPFAIADAPLRRNGRLEHRLLVLADHAVFKNSLMAPAPTAGQTDNILLAQRVVEYLQGPDKQRKRCVFYEEGRVVENFDTVRMMLRAQDPELNMPPLLPLMLGLQDKIVDFGNQILDRVQTKNIHNEQLLGSPDNPGGQARRLAGIATAFLVLGSVWAAWFLLRRVWRSRQPTDNPPPPFAGGSVTADRSGGVFDRRKRELVRRNNLYEPIRDALRDLFTSAGAEGGPGTKPPRVECSQEVRKPAKLREAIADLWRLAYGRPTVVTIRRWTELEPVIERLHRELADGTWRFSDTRSEA